MVAHDPHMNSTDQTGGFSEWKRLPQYLRHAGEVFVVMHPLEHWPDGRILRAEETSPIPGAYAYNGGA
jgi:hypothetical protein